MATSMTHRRPTSAAGAPPATAGPTPAGTPKQRERRPLTTAKAIAIGLTLIAAADREPSAAISSSARRSRLRAPKTSCTRTCATTWRRPSSRSAA